MRAKRMNPQGSASRRKARSSASARATAFIENELSAEHPGFLSLVALIELYWVLHRCYGQGCADWGRTLRGLLTARQIVVENLPAAWHAMLACDEGLDFAAFRRYYEALPAATKRVRVYPILFGDGDSQEMKDLAALTGGRTFDGRKNLASAFKDIRGYQ